jgi:hypothetical protein
VRLTPWMFATLENKALGNRHTVEVVSYPTPAKTIMVRAIPQFPSTLLEVPISHLSPSPAIKAVAFATVCGSGSFPLDMLRYDNAVPANFRLCPDSGMIHRDPDWPNNGLIVATTVLRGYDASKAFTIARWRSFGWTCLPFKVEALKREVA